MARYFELGDTRLAYKFERCEEVILIDAYLHVKPRVNPTDQQWMREFEFYFFAAGKAVTSDAVERINRVLGRIGRPAISFPETTVYEYGRNQDSGFKISERAKIRDELGSMEAGIRARLVEAAKADAQLLPPARVSYKEYFARQDEHRRASEASRMQIQRRALHAAVVKSALIAPKLRPEDVIMLVSETDNAELRERLLGRLSVPEILAVIREVQDQEIKNALVRRVIDRQ